MPRRLGGCGSTSLRELPAPGTARPRRRCGEAGAPSRQPARRTCCGIIPEILPVKTHPFTSSLRWNSRGAWRASERREGIRGGFAARPGVVHKREEGETERPLFRRRRCDGTTASATHGSLNASVRRADAHRSASPWRPSAPAAGRKVIIAPDGWDLWAPARPRPDETLIRALARAHRWQRLLERRCQSPAEIAEAEGVPAASSAGCRLTLLAPDIQEEILDGRRPKTHAAGRADAGNAGRVARAKVNSPSG